MTGKVTFIVGRVGSGKTHLGNALMRNGGWESFEVVDSQNPETIKRVIDDWHGSDNPLLVMIQKLDTKIRSVLMPNDEIFLHSSSSADSNCIYDLIGYDSVDDLRAALDTLGDYEFLRATVVTSHKKICKVTADRTLTWRAVRP